MPNVMAALPNTGGALCSMPQSVDNAQYSSDCSKAAKTRNLLKFGGVLQTTGSGWVSSFLTAHQHIIGHSVP